MFPKQLTFARYRECSAFRIPLKLTSGWWIYAVDSTSLFGGATILTCLDRLLVWDILLLSTDCTVRSGDPRQRMVANVICMRSSTANCVMLTFRRIEHCPRSCLVSFIICAEVVEGRWRPQRLTGDRLGDFALLLRQMSPAEFTTIRVILAFSPPSRLC